MFEAGLVLEGGGMRGLFTAGVLDCFLDHNIHFSTCIGVSAGGCHGYSYVCGQKGRARDVAIDYLDDKNYCGMYSLLTTGNLFNTEMVYKTIPEKYYPLDGDSYKNSLSQLYVVVTDCATGEPEYVKITDIYGQLDYVRASASLPLVSRKVVIGDKKYLDGGIADSIPIERSIAMGNRKNVVVLTQHRAYRKQPDSLYPLMKIRYRKYPGLLHKMKERHNAYNRVLALLDALEERGEIFVIRPQEPVEIGRVEKDAGKLRALYEKGYSEAQRCLANMLKYLNT